MNGSIEELHADAVVTSDFEDFRNISFENSDKILESHFMKKSPDPEKMHTIYTPLMFYEGTDDNVISSCYFSCLDLAKKYHLSSVVFPNYFVTPITQDFINSWLDMNAYYGMTVLVARGNDEDIDNDKDHSVNNAKAEAYRNLVERAKKQYPEYRDGLAKSKGVELFAPTVDGVNICEEINLYTYWQGFDYAKKTPKIKYLLVAQDWGNFINSKDDFKSLIAKKNAGENLMYPFSMESPTDKHLIELFKILERDVTKPCDDVFFTNFCLGYRLGKGAGGMTKKLMMRDADLFRELCKILKPENILCLGKLVSECVYESLSGHQFNEIYHGYKNYNDFLDNHSKIVIRYANGKFSNFYPLAHCGVLGTNNRNCGCDLPEVKADILFKQRQDWQKIIDAERKTAMTKEEKVLWATWMVSTDIREHAVDIFWSSLRVNFWINLVEGV